MRRLTFTPVFLTAAVLLLQTSCLLIPDDKPRGSLVANVPPEVRITGGAMTPDSNGVDYRLHFSWAGSDADGRVIGYQWAVDDTITEGAWHDTTGSDAQFLFHTGLPTFQDSTSSHAWHTFYVRAIDNDFARSAFAAEYFSSKTILPSSQITFPRINSYGGQLPSTFIVRFRLTDLDSPNTDLKPAFCEMKMVRINNSAANDDVARDSLESARNLLLDSLQVGSQKGWLRESGELESFTVSGIQASMFYAFAIRSIDVTGGVEQNLSSGHNLMKFEGLGEQATPHLDVSEASLGSHQFLTKEVWGGTAGLEVPSGKALRFHWTADASWYGGVAGQSRSRWDGDPTDETKDPEGIHGWTDWADWTGTPMPRTFPPEDNGLHHYLYIQERDITGAASSTDTATVNVKVVAFTFNKSLLIVYDNVFDGTSDPIPGNSPVATELFHRRWLRNIVLGSLSSYGPVDTTLGPEHGGQDQTGQSLPLSTLAQYRAIFWVRRPNVEHSLRIDGVVNNEYNGRHLSACSAAGTELFLAGADWARGCNPLLVGKKPTTEDAIHSFYYQFLGMRNEETYYNDPVQFGQFSDNTMIEAQSVNPLYPSIRLDDSKIQPWTIYRGNYLGGNTAFEGSVAQAGDQRVPNAGLDSLYKVKTFGYYLNGGQPTPHSGSSEGAICGFRTVATSADTTAGLQHGRIFVLNFELYPFLESDVINAAGKGIRWVLSGHD